MVILLESSKITMQVTNHFRYMRNTQPHMVVKQGLNLFFFNQGGYISTDKYLFFIHWDFDNFDWDF